MLTGQPLKTVHLTNAYHPTSGGVRSFYQSILNTANALARPVRLIVPGPEHRVERVGRFGCIYFVKAPRAFAFDRRYRLIMPTRYLLPWLHGVRQILRDERPDIVEICDKHSLFYVAGLYKKGWIGNVPDVRLKPDATPMQDSALAGPSRPTLVATSAERFDDNLSTFLSAGPRIAAFARWYMRAIYAPMFDFHLANSEYTAGELRAALPPHRQQIVYISHPGLPEDAFRARPAGGVRQALLEQTGGDSRTKFLLYVGRLSPEKNLGLLIDVMRDLVASERPGGVNVRLVIAGDGPERVRLEALRSELPGRLHLPGNIAGQGAVRQLLEAADVFVHPNPREPFGIAPLEAMAAGLPVVAPDSGGVLSYADESTAWLAPPTASAFAAAVRSVFDQPSLTARRTAAASSRATMFHEALVVPRFFRLLDALHWHRTEGQAVAIPEGMAEGIAREAATSR